MEALKTLLDQLIDYAGLFPPASLPMARAVENDRSYRSWPESWMLGRFVVPAARLQEFAACLAGDAPPLSVLVGADLAADLERIAQSPLAIDVIELKAADAAQIDAAMKRIPRRLTPYFEIAHTDLIPAIAEAGARAKIRMGGNTPETIPSPAQVVKFLAACAGHRIAFKATAGLHHPLRSSDPAGPRYGFLNLLIAAALAWRGAPHESMERAILEESPDAFQFGEAHIAWSGETFTAEEIAGTRREFMISFGSCSFEEPLADLKSLRLLPP